MTNFNNASSAMRLLYWKLGHRKLNKLREEIISWTDAPERRTDPEMREVNDFLRHNPPDFIPYPFTKTYHAQDTEVERDPEIDLNYVMHGGKRLYWREGRKAKRIPRDYHALLAEQDPKSPHRYLTDDFDIKTGDVVVDVGSAEGILSLDVIERASHIYLFEADERWASALEATFRPWKEKVTIVPMFAGDVTQGSMTRLDDFFDANTKIDFLKLDVEGFEAQVLAGANNLITSGRVARAAVCAYHNPEDEIELGTLLRELKFETQVSSGYMLLYREKNLAPPYFRRGLLRATWVG